MDGISFLICHWIFSFSPHFFMSSYRQAGLSLSLLWDTIIGMASFRREDIFPASPSLMGWLSLIAFPDRFLLLLEAESHLSFCRHTMPHYFLPLPLRHIFSSLTCRGRRAYPHSHAWNKAYAFCLGLGYWLLVASPWEKSSFISLTLFSGLPHGPSRGFSFSQPADIHSLIIHWYFII